MSKGRTLINAYGPTENTVCATMHKYSSGDLNTNIGKPINNGNVYILNTQNTPVPLELSGSYILVEQVLLGDI